MTPLVLALIVPALACSAALTALVRAVGRRLLLHDAPGSSGHVKEVRAVPNLGGIAIYWAIAAPMLAGLAFVTRGGFDGAASEWLAPLREHLPGLRAHMPMALGLLGALGALHVMGLIDDRRPLGPRLKFVVMFIVAAAVVVGLDVRLMTALDGFAGGPWLSMALSVVWIVAVTNALNFMDNMDGLAAGVGAVAGSCCLASALLGGQWFVSAALALLVGAQLGFLIFNYPWTRRGATIFMGDGGSLVIGFTLAVLTVRTTYVPEVAENRGGTPWHALLTPLCILAVPLYDMISVVVIRLKQGKSPLVGDRQHFSHRLLGRGLSVREALLVIWGCTAITGLGGILLRGAEAWEAGVIGAQVGLVLVLLAIYERGSSARLAGAGRV